MSTEQELKNILRTYQTAFAAKAYAEENEEHDILMDIFGITPEMKRENRQYWGRELGMCWQRLVTTLCRRTVPSFGPPIRVGADEPCDLTANGDAIDTKYRIGSGDSGTLKKFKTYGPDLKRLGFRPVLLIVREDNLPAAIVACRVGGWTVYQGQGTFDYLTRATGYNLQAFLAERAGAFPTGR